MESFDASASNHALVPHLEFAVPLKILDFKAQGGPTAYDFARLQPVAEMLGYKGDALLFQTGKQDSNLRVFLINRLVESLAVLAFVPGGVKAFGQHWEAKA